MRRKEEEERRGEEVREHYDDVDDRKIGWRHTHTYIYAQSDVN